MSRHLRGRSDSGAVAVLVAIMAVVLFGICALVVDLGQDYVVHGATQKDVDFAALAGGAGDDLPAPPATRSCPYGRAASSTDQAVVDVATYVAEHGLFNRRGDGSTTPVAPASLVDCQLSNGEAVYGRLVGGVLQYDADTLTVLAPPRHVTYGFARVLGFDGTDVTAVATVQIKSPMIRSLPLYAFTGCDYGLQTIAQPANGHAAEIVTLSHAGETNAAILSSLTTSPATTPASVPLGVTAPNDSLVINGSGLANVTDVGFFESGSGSAGPEPVTVPITVPSVTAHTGTSISISDMPTAVSSVRTVWYVRVKIGGSWSEALTQDSVLKALPLQVGSPTLMCGQGSSSGNFGTLKLTNTSTGAPNGQWQNIAYNIIDGTQHPLGLYPNAHSDWLCAATDAGAKVWPADGTNCVDTETGLDLDAAASGFITGQGTGLNGGLLTKVGDHTGCAADGRPQTTVIAGRTLNDDTLSCFFTDDITNVGNITSSTYGLGHPVLSSAIYNSPRFALVPVLGAQPTRGGSGRYQIVDIRAAFITDQTASATKSTPATPTNGITVAANGNGSLQSIQVVFFNASALPPPPDGTGVTDYVGRGPKLLRLVN